MIALSVNSHANAGQITSNTKTCEVVMYLGVPPESLREEDRKNLEPEKPLLTALVKPDGNFQADNEGASFEGTISNEKDDKVQVQIKESHLNSTSCFQINALVKPNEPIVPKACGFSSIVFSYYFRVRSTADEVANAQDLTCEIAVPPEVHIIDGWIDASLIVRNVSAKPIRICTLVSGRRGVGKGSYTEIFSPDWWKSDRPRPANFAESLVTLYPDETFIFPIKIHYEYSVEFFRGLPLTISSGYRTGKEFAKQYDTWEGSIEAKPVSVTVVE